MAIIPLPDGSTQNIQIGNEIEASDSNYTAYTRDGSNRIEFIEITSSDYYGPGSMAGNWTVIYQFSYFGVETTPASITRNVINTV